MNVTVRRIQLSNLAHERGLELIDKEVTKNNKGNEILLVMDYLFQAHLKLSLRSDALAKQSRVLSVLIVEGPLRQQQVLL